MLGADVSGDPSERTAADNQTVRNVFVVGPDKKIKLMLVYPMTTARKLDEVLRVIDSLQLTAKHKVSTPVNWREGDPVIIAGSVSNDQEREMWPEGWEEPKPYIRIVPAPASRVGEGPARSTASRRRGAGSRTPRRGDAYDGGRSLSSPHGSRRSSATGAS